MHLFFTTSLETLERVLRARAARLPPHDNKSCSIDEDWQAARFVYRKDDPRRATGS